MSRSAAAVVDRRIGAAVRCTGVVHVYRESGVDVAALRGVDLEVGAGERVALLGPSGSGKSTLLTILAGLRRPSAGTVLVDDLDIATTGERERYRYRSGLGLMLQGAGSNLLGWGTPMDNVRYAGGRRGLEPAVEVLRAGGLDGHRGPVRRLEVADRQVVALATALAGRPRMLLVDEPTSQLDEDARDRLLDLMVEGATAAGTTVVVVTHDEDVASRMQRMVRMREGRVGSEGLRHDQYAIVGADGSVQLPEALLAGWPPGSAVEVSADGADVIRLTRRSRRQEAS